MQICDDKLLIFQLLLLVSVMACETSEILTFTAHEGGKVEIQCPYEAKYEEYKKYLCRGECPIVIKDKLIESESAAKDKRFSLSDNKTTHIFTVAITDLRTEDRGQYWCGVKTGFGSYDYKREIYLEIKHETTTASFHTSSPVAEDTESDRTVTSSSSSSSSSSSVLMLFSSTANGMSPKPQPGFAPIIMVVVLGILTGLGFSMFIYLRRRQKEEGTQPKDVVHGPTNNLPSGDTGETSEATHTVYDYGDIISTIDHPDYSLVLPAFAKSDASVYALAQLPSIPSDILYSSIKFTAAHPSDRASDGQETCNYASIATVPEILNGDERVGAVVLHAGTNDIRLRQIEVLKKDYRSLIETTIIVYGPLPTYRLGQERLCQLQFVSSLSWKLQMPQHL
ncbi:CMRF35-like molecule 5 [Carassius carassius]|uniref:CMRF35-like molecule 5 n=1 Tax=Carassius carassius TaxID=217509 RepID=UPI0028697EAE|nr:CMRF35-like molecule 5 [Carassius carassius]